MDRAVHNNVQGTLFLDHTLITSAVIVAWFIAEHFKPAKILRKLPIYF